MLFRIDDCRTPNHNINAGLAGANNLDDLKDLITTLKEKLCAPVWVDMTNNVISIGVMDFVYEDDDEDEDWDDDDWDDDDDDEYYYDEEDDEIPLGGGMIGFGLMM